MFVWKYHRIFHKSLPHMARDFTIFRQTQAGGLFWTPLKYISRLGLLFPIYGKIKMSQTTNQQVSKQFKALCGRNSDCPARPDWDGRSPSGSWRSPRYAKLWDVAQKISWLYLVYICLPSGYLTVRHGIDGPNRNRWFTEINSMVIFQFAMLVITRWYSHVYNIYWQFLLAYRLQLVSASFWGEPGKVSKDPALGIVTRRFWRSGLRHAVPIMSTLPWWQWKIHENPTYADDFPHQKW